MQEINITPAKENLIVRKCHVCGHVNESFKEQERCNGCRKSFLPSNYFGKVHAKNEKEFKNLFSTSDELREEDLLKGVMTIW